MSEGSDLDKTEEATPFRLRKARERGQVARGMDLGFVASLLAVTAVALAGGQAYFARLAQVMAQTLGGGVASARDPLAAVGQVGALYWVVLQPLALLGATIAAIVIALEIVQLRGFLFTLQPLKPDFQRLNPAKGLKRLFSLRMLKETAKNLLKVTVYTIAAWVIIGGIVARAAPTLSDASRLATAMESGIARLLTVFIALAFGFMIIDQLLVRREYRKQLRMTRRDVTRENKDREGEPRFKQRRRDLHAQLREQTSGLGKVAGSDFLVVNPDHYAVAMRYVAGEMAAPQVRAKGRDHFAQLMKRKAGLLGVPILAQPAVARALYADCAAGQEIPQQHYRAVATLYRHLANLTGRDAAMTKEPIE